MRRIPFLFSAFLFAGILVLSACGEEDDTDPINITPVDTTVDCATVTYSGTIKTIVAGNCSGSSCHGANAPNGDFTSYDGIRNVATNGRMRTQVLEDMTMPQGGSLTAQQLSQIKCWLDDGAPEN